MEFSEVENKRIQNVCARRCANCDDCLKMTQTPIKLGYHNSPRDVIADNYIGFDTKWGYDLCNINCRDCARCRTFQKSEPDIVYAGMTPRDWFQLTQGDSETFRDMGFSRNPQPLNPLPNLTPLPNTGREVPVVRSRRYLVPGSDRGAIRYAVRGAAHRDLILNGYNFNILNYAWTLRPIPNRYMTYWSNNVDENKKIRPENYHFIETT